MIAAGSAAAGRALDAALLDAHARGDVTALIGLYARAADRAEQAGAAEPAAFFRTQAWVFALEAGERDILPDRYSDQRPWTVTAVRRAAWTTDLAVRMGHVATSRVRKRDASGGAPAARRARSRARAREPPMAAGRLASPSGGTDQARPAAGQDHGPRQGREVGGGQGRLA
jgi:hypothetical protein